MEVYGFGAIGFIIGVFIGAYLNRRKQEDTHHSDNSGIISPPMPSPRPIKVNRYVSVNEFVFVEKPDHSIRLGKILAVNNESAVIRFEHEKEIKIFNNNQIYKTEV